MHPSRRLLEMSIELLAWLGALSLAIGVFAPHLDATWLWLRGGGIPTSLVTVVLVAFSLTVLVLRHVHPRGRAAARISGGALGLLCLADAFQFFTLVLRGQVQSSLPIPLSLLLGLLLLLWACAPRPRPRQLSPQNALWQRVARGGSLVVLASLGVLGHLITFGSTDYRRPADAAVVLGAAVRPSGAPSGALLDRTLTGCELYHQGLVDTLVMSGGRDPAAPISEPECMRRIALEAGVPAEAIVLDEAGLTTDSTVREVARIADEQGWSRLLFVSHDYHLARVKLSAERRGLTAFTVPARERRQMRKKPVFVAREVLAFAWYFAQAN